MTAGGERVNEDQTAAALAAAHRAQDAGTSRIMYFPEPGVVRLLEVSTSAPTTGEILPFSFEADRAHNVPFPSIVVLVSPDEWAQIQAGTLTLPAGWDLASIRSL
jgi:hypothetical protein